MTDIAATDFRHPRRHVRLDTILRLRWLAALGQLAAIFVVAQGLEFELPIVPCLVIIALSAVPLAGGELLKVFLRRWAAGRPVGASPMR